MGIQKIIQKSETPEKYYIVLAHQASTIKNDTVFNSIGKRDIFAD